MSINRQKAAIWDRWTIFCGVPLKKSVMPTNQMLKTIEHLKANIRDAIDEITPYQHSKKCTKIGTI